MNIFVLDRNPQVAAEYLCNEHVIKMLTESVQMIATTSILLGGESPPKKNGDPYKISHQWHPCTKWVMDSRDNWEWLVAHALGIAGEFRKRYGKEHAGERSLMYAISHCTAPAERGMTPFALCMPPEYKHRDAVVAYRQFYLGEKSRFAAWEPRATTPEWFRENRI